MPTFFIEYIDRNRYSVRKPVHHEEILTILTSAQERLQRLFDDHTAALLSNSMCHSIDVPDFSYALSSLNNKSTFSLLSAKDYMARFDPVRVLEAFNGHIAAQQNKINLARIEGFKPITWLDYDGESLFSSRLFMAEVCEGCGAAINVVTYGAHKQSLKCLTDTATRDLREKGWIELQDSKTVAAIKRAGVHMEARPSGHSLWVDKWVMDAIASWQSNDGFGGLKLYEYLEKMAPSEDKQGQ